MREGASRKVGLLAHSARYLLFMPVNPVASRQEYSAPVGRPNLWKTGGMDQSDDQLRNSIKMLKCSENINSARHILDCYTLHTIHILHSTLVIRSHYAAVHALNIASQVADRDRLGPGSPAGVLAPDCTHRRRLWAPWGHECGGLPHQSENRGLPLSPKQLPRAGTANLVPRGQRPAAVRLRALDVRRLGRHIRGLLRQEVAPATLAGPAHIPREPFGSARDRLSAIRPILARGTLDVALATLRARATTYSSRRRNPRWSWSP